MRTLWTLAKVLLALALAIPLAIIVLATAVGVLGAVVGIAFVALKLAVAVLICYGLFRVVRSLLRGPAPAPAPRSRVAAQLPPVDPHYEAAMRELDQELGDKSR